MKKGFLLAIPLFALSIASYVSGHFVQGELRKMQWVTLIGIIITACAVSVSTLFEHYVYVMSVFLLAGIGIGMILPCLDGRISESIEAEIRGAMMAIYSSMRFIGVALGPPVVALLMKKNMVWIAVLFTVIAIISTFLAFQNKKINAS